MKMTLPLMRKTAVTAGLICSSLLAHTQAPTYSWAKNLSGTGADLGIRMATDAAGNTYTTGSFNGTVDFDPDAVATFDLTSAGGTDVYVCKLDAAGNFVWAVNMGGSSDDVGQSLAVDATGNVYLTGTFKATADFDPAVSGTTNLISAGGSDIFVMKIDATGTSVWAQGTGGSADDAGTAIVVDGTGNLYVAGTIGATTTADFDPDMAGTAELTSFGGTDDFVWKLTNGGNFVFIKQLGGSVSDLCNALTLDASGNIYVAGSFNGTSDFDPDAVGSATLTSAGSNDIFVCKLDATGSYVWAKGVGNSMTDIANFVAVDNAGNVIVTGSFASNVDFDPEPFSATILPASGLSDPFVWKLDALGNFVWARHFTGTGFDRGTGLAIDAANNIYVSGLFASSMDFDPDAVGTFNITSAGSNDAFVCYLNAAGTFQWAISAGGSGDDAAQSIQLANGKMYITGRYSTTADFDPDAVATANLVSLGSTDIYVAQYQLACTPTSHTMAATACYMYESPSGNYTWTMSGTYNDTIANAGGCDSVITINLTINTANVSVTSGSVTITATATPATYQWVDCNAAFAIIGGETNQTFTATSNGSYAVIVTQLGCTDTSSCVNITATGIDPVNNASTLQVYPNPSNGALNVTVQKAGTLTIADLNGKTVYTHVLAAGNNQLELTQLPAGVYTVQATGTEEQKIKWIKL